MIRKDLVVAVLATFCLTVITFTVIPVGSIGGSRYNPWLDYNDDGKIDVRDVAPVAAAYGSKGTPLVKASMQYDSGWLNITDKCGQNITMTHGLNTTDWNTSDIVLDISGRTKSDGAFLRDTGLKGRVPGWNRSYTGDLKDDNHGYSVVKTDDGGYAFTGYGMRIESEITNSIDIYLFKADQFGAVQWRKTYSLYHDDYAYSLVKADDGGYAIAGMTDTNGHDFFLIKTDSSGNLIWTKNYGTGAKEEERALIKTSDGGYALVGWVYQGGNYDLWFVKTDSSGNLQWSRSYGGPGDDRATSVVQTTDGGYALAGYTSSYGAGGEDFWLVRTDSYGNMLWNGTYGGGSNEEAHAIALVADGFTLAGDTESYGAGGYDFWLVKTDFMGNMVWNRTYGGAGWERAYAMISTSDGGYALTCYTNSFGAGGYDAWLVKTDENGMMQWNKTYGGVGDEMAEGLIQNREGSYILVGYTLYPEGIYSFWLVDTGFESGLACVDLSADTMTLYRGATDVYWNFVRVRLWRPRQTP
jgi:predicted secreted protein